MYSVLSTDKREKIVNEKKVRVIRDYLRKRRKLEIAKEDELAHLNQLCKDRSIDKETYYRLKQLLFLTYEQKRLDLVKAVLEKNSRTVRTSSICDNQQTKAD